MRDQDWLVALSSLERVGWTTVERVLSAAVHLSDLAQEEAPSLLRAHGLPAALAARIRQEMQPSRAEERLQQMVAQGYRWVTLWDDAYPPLLREIAKPPWVLYYKGDFSLLRQPALAVVGTRRATPYGQMAAHKLAKELAAAGWCIVSGMATGIDTFAHQGALSAKGATVAVLGTGINTIYPAGNRALYEGLARDGLVLSEYPGHTSIHPGLFPQRNRIVSGLCLGTAVIEAGERSGALITADLALEQGREVFAVPGPISSPYSRGPHQLLKQGAKLLQQASDVMDEFPWLQSVPLTSGDELAALTPAERSVLELMGYTQMSIEQLVSASRMQLAELYPLLLKLQLKKQIRQLPGSFFVRV